MTRTPDNRDPLWYSYSYKRKDNPVGVTNLERPRVLSLGPIHGGTRCLAKESVIEDMVT